MNPLYQQLMGSQPTNTMFTPVGRLQALLQAMNNPAAYLKQKFPDIPDAIMNDPNQILSYLQRTRGITDQDIRNAQMQMPGGTPWPGQ